MLNTSDDRTFCIAETLRVEPVQIVVGNADLEAVTEQLRPLLTELPQPGVGVADLLDLWYLRENVVMKAVCGSPEIFTSILRREHRPPEGRSSAERQF